MNSYILKEICNKVVVLRNSSLRIINAQIDIINDSLGLMLIIVRGGSTSRGIPK